MKFSQPLLVDIHTLWDYHLVYDDLSGVDAIVCLGSYDLRVAEYCADLLLAGVSEVAVVTGGFGNWTRDVFPKAEAAVFADRIVARGVTRDRLLIEPKASNIGENIAFSGQMLMGRPFRRVAFLTKPQTQRRVLATVPVKWPEVEARISAPRLSLEQQAGDEAGLVLSTEEMVGDLERMLGYPKLGFQVAVEVPAHVTEAYLRLRKAGFDRHCIGRGGDRQEI